MGTTRARAVKLYHVTHKSNLESILAGGLDPAKAKGLRKSVWGVVRTRAAWAIVHVLSKPWNAGATLEDVVVIELRLPKKAVRRYHVGIWHTAPGTGVIPVTANMVKDAAQFGRVGN